MMITKAIYFDMDGTLAGFYDCENWLADLINGYTRPYREAKSLINMRKLGILLNQLHEQGYHIGIVSWLSKSGTEEYNQRVIKTKERWLSRHIGAVNWDEIKIIPYGTPKSSVVEFPSGILFDDEERNRKEWAGATDTGIAFDVDNILEILSSLI